MSMFRVWDQRKNRKFQVALLAWYARHKRDLPWRRAPSPYRVWLSEIMLQQTQVQTVLPYYARFLRLYPNIRSLAAAPEREVLSAWSGLGYYSRARNLHRAARILVEQHGGDFPKDDETILNLPGIGRYTAGAIQSIAFNLPRPIVDGNVRRVISRLHGIRGRVKESYFWQQAAAWIDSNHPSDFNQAVMELGALVCVPFNPVCRFCPVRSLCLARSQGIQDQIPSPRLARKGESINLVMLVLESGNRLLIVRQKRAAFIPGEWALPTGVVEDKKTSMVTAQALLRKTIGAEFVLEKQAKVRHSITYRRIHIDVYRGKIAGVVKPSHGQRWIARNHLERYLTSSAFLKGVRLEKLKTTGRNSPNG